MAGIRGFFGVSDIVHPPTRQDQQQTAADHVRDIVLKLSPGESVTVKRSSDPRHPAPFTVTYSSPVQETDR